MNKLNTLEWKEQSLVLVDQTLLPIKEVYRTYTTSEGVREAISTMIVRGAPAIGVAAGYGMVLAALATGEDSYESFAVHMKRKGEDLISARPTAVNLPWAVKRMLRRMEELRELPVAVIKEKLEEEAILIHMEDVALNRAIGENLLNMLKPGDTVLTHCNAGSLATSGCGTALAPFYVAQEKGFPIKVYADETRPRLQGARLSAYELHRDGVDVTLICDNMAAVVMSQGKIDAVIVGCDRVAANGDTANKIGTFSVSILAKHFGIPMYIAAPTTTIDMDCPTGKEIPVEERDASEIVYINDVHVAPVGIKVYNPAFDVTPAENITAIVTEKGVARAPYAESLKKIMGSP